MYGIFRTVQMFRFNFFMSVSSDNWDRPLSAVIPTFLSQIHLLEGYKYVTWKALHAGPLFHWK